MSQLSLFDASVATVPAWQHLGHGWAPAHLGAWNVLHFWGTPHNWWQTACPLPFLSGGPATGGTMEFVVSNPPPPNACPDCAARWLLATAGQQGRDG